MYPIWRFWVHDKVLMYPFWRFWVHDGSLRDELAAGAEVDVAGKGAQHAATGEIVEGRGRREGGGDAGQGRGGGISEAHYVGGGGFCGRGGGERQARHGMAVAVGFKMAFQFEGQAGFLGGEARVARFAVAAGGEEVALVGESAPLEGKVRNILHQRREVPPAPRTGRPF